MAEDTVEHDELSKQLQQIASLGSSHKLVEAEALCRQLLSDYPNHPQLLHYLGIITLENKQFEEAILLLQQAVTMQPTAASFHHHLGAAYASVERYSEAIHHFEYALCLDSSFKEARLNLITCYQRTGEISLAEIQLRHLVQDNPEDTQLLKHLGHNLLQQRKFAGAITFFETAHKIDKSDQEISILLANAYEKNQQWDEAIALYEAIIKNDPTYLPAYKQAAAMLNSLKSSDKAILHLEQALAIAPDDPELLDAMMVASRDCCDWDVYERWFSELERVADERLAKGVNTHISPFNTLLLPFSPEKQYQLIKNAVDTNFNHLASIRKDLGFTFTKQAKKRLRIGYISGDFRDHPVAYLLLSLFSLHNRENVEVVGYSLNPEMKNSCYQKIAADCDMFRNLSQLSIIDAAKQIYSDEIDILVDLMGHTVFSRIEILGLKPAPIQVSYLGFLGTSGTDFIDYILTDNIVTPAGESIYYTENFLPMPDTFMVTDGLREKIQSTVSRSSCGLPEDENIVILACLNNCKKITREDFHSWMRILKEAPQTVLWLFTKSTVAEKNLIAEAAKEGIGADRIVFFSERVPRALYLERLALVDLFLDTSMYNAGATAIDHLFAEVPLLTLMGDRFVSRMAASMLHALGMDELITTSRDAYEEKAIYLANHPSELTTLKHIIAKHKQTYPLFQTSQFVHHLEERYQTIWERYVGG